MIFGSWLFYQMYPIAKTRPVKMTILKVAIHPICKIMLMFVLQTIPLFLNIQYFIVYL